MFNGIIESVGIIEDIQLANDCKNFTIFSDKPFDDLNIDDSIAVNGVCLTVIHKHHQRFVVTAVPETLRLTNLNFLINGGRVNLERAMALNSRMSGHYVQGHVDGVGKILDIQSEGDALLVNISIPLALEKYIVNKGFIALDGMSITVIRAEQNTFTVTFIPHTQKMTLVNQYAVGTLINIEVDMLGKYVEKMLGAYHANI